MNKQLNRQLRKKVSQLGMENFELGNQTRYVLGFIQFLQNNGVDVQTMEQKYRKWIDEQKKV